jgi:hypothetical protein
MHFTRPLWAFILTISFSTPLLPQTVVFREAGFPAVDTAPAPERFLQQFAGARFATTSELKQQLSSARLLILPYGSAFPEESWPEIDSFLERGGNLLVLGGRPFTHAAYREGNTWKIHDYSVRYTRPLRIDQYHETPGSEGLKVETNPDIPLQVPQFSWRRSFSPIIHLSATALYPRGGSAGSIDSGLDALVWGSKEGRRVAAPVIQVDHFRNGFNGGRWIFVAADLTQDFYSSAAAIQIISNLAQQALHGAEEFTVRPVLPLYLPGEPVEVEVHWSAASTRPASVSVAVGPAGQTFATAPAPVPLPLSQPLVYPAPTEKGLHVVYAHLYVDGKLRRLYRSAFWIRDLDYLRSGPKLSVNPDYFELDGKPLAVIGTTYMASDVQRLYFERPNVYVWDRDMRQIHEAGLNMLRTGWWTGWDKFIDENGRPYERTLRILEAYLMTARQYSLPVQFNIFAFLPDVLGGANPYLDPETVGKQTTLVSTIATRFREVPFLAYDLINEPSFSKRIWTMRPNGDWVETQKWNEWLDRHYPDRAALAAAWNLPISSVQGRVGLPEEIDFSPRAAYDGGNPLKTFDYQMFAQESFAQWVRMLREAIHGAGSSQLITVGQDEGGFQNRNSPAFFAPSVDFTTNHSWWQNDAILWDSLVAKQPGKAMLIQETGLQRELNLDSTSRRTPESEAALFERKVAMSLVQGSGAIEWLWNTNSYMTEGNEVAIGALRADGTEKPEAVVMREFAKFAAALSPHLRNPQPAPVAVIASQAAQYSAIADLQIEAQRKAVRALAYCAPRLAPYLVYENQIDKMGSPKLVILPSAQALTEKAWRALLQYVDGGGNLLITGPVERDEHWQRVNRAAQLFPGTTVEPLTFHNALIVSFGGTGRNDLTAIPQGKIPLVFNQAAQNWLESLSFGDDLQRRGRGDNVSIVAHGKGQIVWAAYPVELADGDFATAQLYSLLREKLGLEPEYKLGASLPEGVMVYPVALGDSVLYILVADSADSADVDLTDKSTGVRTKLKLQAGHAALALIGNKERAVIAQYGF